MRPLNTAEQILRALGVFQACGMIKRIRYATPERQVMGRNGTKRAGAYGKGLRNWITRTQAAKQANRLTQRHV
jgi:hypothetical protein